MIDQLQRQSLQFTQQVIFFATERIARACLHLDPGTRARLDALSGKCIRIHIRDSVPYYRNGIEVFVFPSARGIELAADTQTAADASLSLNAKDLLALLRSKPTSPNLDIQGDDAVLLAVLDIVKGFDIDWEKAIAPVAGDVIAHQVGRNIRATEKWLSASFADARRLAREYLDEELPVARQSKAFKPVFDNFGRMKSAGDAVRDKLADAAAKTPWFTPKR